jgi:hypothetical protein
MALALGGRGPLLAIRRKWLWSAGGHAHSRLPRQKGVMPMPLSYVAVFCLALLAVIIGRQRLDSGMVSIAAAFVILIAAFSVMFLVIFCAVLVLAWPRRI